MSLYEIYILIKNKGIIAIDYIKNSDFINDNRKGIIVGVIVATIIFIFKDNEKLKSLLNYFENKNKEKELLERVNKIIKEQKIDFEKAKQIIITEELLNGVAISKPSWFLKDDRLVYQGQRISFYDKEIGLIVGDFLGLIVPDIVGYDSIYVVRIINRNFIRQAPISFVDEETLQIY